MNRIVKIAALLIALTAVFSFSQESPSVPTEKPITCEPIQKVNSDSITLKVLKDVEVFYSNSFKDIHDSYVFFLTLIAILCTIVAIICTIVGIIWDRKARKYENETKEGLKEVKKDIDEYKEMKKDFEKIKNEFEDEKKLLEENRKEIYGEIEYTYFSLAIFSSKVGIYEEHFNMLAEHFATFRKRNIKPERIDLQRLIHFDDFIKKYDGNNIEIAKIFFCELDKFIKYGEKTYIEKNSIEAIFLEKINEIWKKVCDKFGGEDKVLEALKNFKSHL